MHVLLHIGITDIYLTYKEHYYSFITWHLFLSKSYNFPKNVSLFALNTHAFLSEDTLLYSIK